MFCITQLQSVEAPTNLLVLLLTFPGSDSLSQNENIFKRGVGLFIWGFCENSKGISGNTDLHKKKKVLFSWPEEPEVNHRGVFSQTDR